MHLNSVDHGGRFAVINKIVLDPESTFCEHYHWTNFRDDENICTLNCWQSVGGVFGGFGGFFGGPKSQNKNYSLYKKSDELDYCYKSKNFSVIGKIAIEADKLSIKFRFFFIGLCFLGSLGLASLGGYLLDDKRRLLSSALIAGGFLLGCLGLSLGLIPPGTMS